MVDKWVYVNENSGSVVFCLSRAKRKHARWCIRKTSPVVLQSRFYAERALAMTAVGVEAASKLFSHQLPLTAPGRSVLGREAFNILAHEVMLVAKYV